MMRAAMMLAASGVGWMMISMLGKDSVFSFQLRLYPLHGEGGVGFVELDAGESAFEAGGGEGGGAAPEEGVKEVVAFVGGGEKAALEQGERFLRGVAAV